MRDISLSCNKYVYIYVGGGDSAIHGHHNDNLIMGYGTATKNKVRSVLLHDGGDQ